MNALPVSAAGAGLAAVDVPPLAARDAAADPASLASSARRSLAPLRGLEEALRAQGCPTGGASAPGPLPVGFGLVVASRRAGGGSTRATDPPCSSVRPRIRPEEASLPEQGGGSQPAGPRAISAVAERMSEPDVRRHVLPAITTGDGPSVRARCPRAELRITDRVEVAAALGAEARRHRAPEFGQETRPGSFPEYRPGTQPGEVIDKHLASPTGSPGHGLEPQPGHEIAALQRPTPEVYSKAAPIR